MTGTTTTHPALEPLGWDPSFEREYELNTRSGAVPGRVVARQRDGWTVATVVGERLSTAATERRAVAAGRVLRTGPEPAVGDWVVVDVPGEGDGVVRIVDVVPRRGAFRRRAAGGSGAEQVVAANVDVALVLSGLPADLNPRRVERYLTLAWDSGAVPVIVLTKVDLSPDPGKAVAAAAEAAAVAPGVAIHTVSAVTGEGVDGLRRSLAPRATAVLVGSSGVGKSTLLNRLLGEERVRTAEVRADGRGRHTTTARQLFVTPWGALIIDTPGMREVGLWADAGALDATFPEIEALAAGCRFRDCAHDTEPDCAVRAAVEHGTLPAERLESWHRLRRELAHIERQRDPLAAAAEAARWGSIKRSVRDHLKRRLEKGDG